MVQIVMDVSVNSTKDFFSLSLFAEYDLKRNKQALSHIGFSSLFFMKRKASLKKQGTGEQRRDA